MLFINPTECKVTSQNIKWKEDKVFLKIKSIAIFFSYCVISFLMTPCTAWSNKLCLKRNKYVLVSIITIMCHDASASLLLTN